MELPLNRGLQTYWLTPSTSDTKPEIVRNESTFVFPALISVKEVDGKEQFTYFPVTLKYEGDDLSNYAKVVRNRYADLREYFYGPAWAQSEMESKGLWTAHSMAVRAVFAKTPGEVPEALQHFWEAYGNFWGLISATCQQFNIPYSEIPESFDSSFMMQIATKYGIPADALTQLILKMQLIQFDVLANKYVWKNLFPKPSDQVLIALLG